MGVTGGGLLKDNLVSFDVISNRRGLCDDSEVDGLYFSRRKPPSLLEDAGLRGPDNGCKMCPPNPRSLGPHILISCFFPLQPGVPFGRKDVVAVFARRNSCKTPVMRPTRFKTTVAIMAVRMVGFFIVMLTNQGVTNAYKSLGWSIS